MSSAASGVTGAASSTAPADGPSTTAVTLPEQAGGAGAGSAVTASSSKFQVPEDPETLSPKTKQDLKSDEVAMTAKLRYTVNRGKTPKEKQSRPLSTSQEVGWRPSVELFGVSYHGIRRDEGLWPQ